MSPSHLCVYIIPIGKFKKIYDKKCISSIWSQSFTLFLSVTAKLLIDYVSVRIFFEYQSLCTYV